MRRGLITGLDYKLFIWDNDFMTTQHDCGACHGYASGSIHRPYQENIFPIKRASFPQDCNVG
jgi:hypothetical protein